MVVLEREGEGGGWVATRVARQGRNREEKRKETEQSTRE